MQEKADDLNRRAWLTRVSDSNLAFILSKEAVEISTAIGYIKGRAEGLRTQGFCFIRLSRHAEALPLLEEAEVLFTRLGDACGQSDVSEYLGIIARSQGDYAASLNHLYRALDLRQKEKYRDGESLSLYHLGVTYRYLGNLDKALEYFLQSLSLAREINHWIAESYSLNNIGSIYYELEDDENALEYYNQSLSIRRSTGDKWGEAGCLDNIGNIHFKLQQYDEAMDFYQQALSITIEVGDRKGQSNSLLHLANIYLKKSDTGLALLNANGSLQIREETGDKKGQAEVYLCLAEITTANTAVENAGETKIDFLQKALLIGEETKALDLLCNIHNSLYTTYKNLHQYNEALKQLEEFYALEKQVHSNTLKQKVIALETTHQIGRAHV